MQIFVDPAQRYAKMRAHTATHLLHAQLAEIFPQTKQAGSLVDQDYLRFDFYADTILTDKQLSEIETNISNLIAQAHPVSTQEMSYDDAIAAGAKAFFEDKYDDTVRVVKIGSSSGGNAEGSYTQDSSLRSEGLISIELCGGTHVENTAHIGAFTIVSQESVAAGTKRITAVTGPKVADELRIKNGELRGIAQVLGVQEKQIMQKIEKINDEKDEVSHKYDTFFRRVVEQEIKRLEWKDINGLHTYNVDTNNILSLENFKNIANELSRTIGIEGDRILYNNSGNFCIVSLRAQEIQKGYGLKGGGSDTFIQGKDPAIIELIAKS